MRYRTVKLKYTNTYILILSGLFFFSGISSCNKIDQPQTTYDLLLGTWKLNQFGADNNNNHQIDPTEITQIEAGYDDEVTFSKNGSGKEVIKTGSRTSTYIFIWTISALDTITRVGTGRDTIKYFLSYVSNSNLTLLENVDTLLVGNFYIRR